MNDDSKIKLTQGVHKLIKSAPKDKIPEIYSMLEHYILLYTSQIENSIKASERAQFFNLIVEMAFKNLFSQAPEIKDSISCKAGCSSCCKNLINIITFDEAALLYEYSLVNNIEIPNDRLKLQALNDTQEKWNDLPEDIRRCVFLSEEGLCKVYDVRPISCRRAILKSDPKICDSFTPQKIERVISPICEVVDCAVLNVVPSDTFSKMLYYVITQYESDTQNSELSAST